MPRADLKGGRRLRFLVVDDSEDIRDVFCCLIERTGHHTSTARDGQEAVEILQRESFDVMLLDLNMPRLDGLGVARWLKANPDVGPAMRVVVVSAWTHQDLTSLVELGIETVIQKPLPLQRLDELIAETLRDIESRPSGTISADPGAVAASEVRDGRRVD